MADLPGERVHRLCHLNFLEFLREQARWSGDQGAIEERDGLLLFATGSSYPVEANGVLVLDDCVSPMLVLDEADEWFAARRRGYTLLLDASTAHGAALREVAVDRGLVPVGETPAMVRFDRVGPVDGPDDVEIVAVDDLTLVEEFTIINDVAQTSLGMPPGIIEDTILVPDRFLEPHIRGLVARRGGRAVATSLVLFSHGIAGVYYVATVEDERGRGLGARMTSAALNLGFDLGAELVTLQASSMGESLYRRLGFQELRRYTELVRFP